MSIQVTKPLVFLVDDEQDILDNYTVLLGNDYEFLYFTNPVEVVKYFEDGKKLPDLIVTDFKMPELTGLAMLKKIQKLEVHVPAILISAYVDKETALLALDLGVFKILEKPVDFVEAAKAVTEMIIERKLYLTRLEIRKKVAQLKELYVNFRIIMSIKSEELDALFKDPSVMDLVPEKNGSIVTFEDYTKKLESQLDELLNLERNFDFSKQNKYHTL